MSTATDNLPFLGFPPVGNGMATMDAPAEIPDDAAGSNSSTGASPLSKIPTDIAERRAFLFALDTPVQFTPASWDRYWPFIDNVWCINQKHTASKRTGITKVYGACRLARHREHPLPKVHEKSRTRVRRKGGTCQAKFRLTIYPDGRRLIERTGEAHTHTLDYMDSTKRSSGIRNLVVDSFFESCGPRSILAYLRDTASSTSGSPSTNILNDAGGLYLRRQEITNILNSGLNKEHPGQDKADFKEQMEKYKSCTTCNVRGCNAPVFPSPKELLEHTKSVHGVKTYDHSDKLYKCSIKTCWRRKKSKGFTTMLGLEEHMKKHHSDQNSSTGSQDFSNDQPDPVLENEMPELSMPMLNMNVNFGNMSGFIPDPYTHQSYPGYQNISLRTQQVQAGAQLQNVVGQTEREAMKARIMRLQVERLRLDEEIKRLNRNVYGDERGEIVGGMQPR